MACRPEAERVPPPVSEPEHDNGGKDVEAGLSGVERIDAARDREDAGADDGAVNGPDKPLRPLVGGISRSCALGRADRARSPRRLAHAQETNSRGALDYLLIVW